MANHNGTHNSGHQDLTSAEVTNDLLERHQRTGLMYKRALILFGALFVLGIIGFIARLVSDGFSDKAAWGYYAATFAFILSTAQAAPMVAIAARSAFSAFGGQPARRDRKVSR